MNRESILQEMESLLQSYEFRRHQKEHAVLLRRHIELGEDFDKAENYAKNLSDEEIEIESSEALNIKKELEEKGDNIYSYTFIKYAEHKRSKGK